MAPGAGSEARGPLARPWGSLLGLQELHGVGARGAGHWLPGLPSVYLQEVKQRSATGESALRR